MANFLLPATPLYGHVHPMVAIGHGLVTRGHRVSMLTGRKYRAAVESHGMRFVPLPPEADYDDAHLDAWLPGRTPRRGIAAGRRDILGMFIGPLAAQHMSLTAAVEAGDFDGIVCEAAFLGVLPLLRSVPAEQRIPVVGISVTPLALTSVDTAPFGSGLRPGHSARHRRRNRRINRLLHLGPLRPVQTALNAALHSVGAGPAEGNYFDQATKFDITFQLTVPGFEYPRRELPDTVRFVGPLRTESGMDQLPRWWPDLDGSRPVVHVTQGTLDNCDLTKLIVPTVRALAGQEVLVVASTGGRPDTELRRALAGGMPDNARVATFLPYSGLLPKTAVMVTNGGYGGVQRALAAGVPLVVAGATEDKPEVAARVAWSGAGINLRSGSPSPRRIRAAVGAALHDSRYRRGAERLQREIAAAGDPLVTVLSVLEDLTGESLVTRHPTMP